MCAALGRSATGRRSFIWPHLATIQPYLKVHVQVRRWQLDLKGNSGSYGNEHSRQLRTARQTWPNPPPWPDPGLHGRTRRAFFTC